MWDWSLVSGTAQLFDPLCKAATFDPRVSAEGTGYRQSVCLRRLVHRAHIPQSPRSELTERRVIERLELLVVAVVQST
jgi:hypothetical protein